MKTQEATTTTTTARKPAKSKAAKGARKPVPKKAAAKAPKAIKTAKAKDGTRAGSKTSIVLELLRRKDGATLAEIAKATEWQNHSIRGFISGQVTKKLGLKVESTKSEAGERTYRIA